MYVDADRHPLLVTLARSQFGVVSRAQLRDLGVSAAYVTQQLELAGFRAVGTEAKEIHLVVPRGDKGTPFPDVRRHESRRLDSAWLVAVDGLPVTEVSRSAIDAAARQRWPRFAVDVAGGSQSLGEIDLLRLCRQHSLAEPRRQTLRVDRSGHRRYLDCEWVLADSRRIVLEVDGRHHMNVSSWQDDLRRERSVTLSGARVLRATAFEVRLEPAGFVGGGQFRTLGR